MGEYFVVFDAAPVSGTDGQVGRKPLASSNVLAPLQTAKVAYVEASSAANASAVVHAVYTPQAGMSVEGTTFTGEKPITVTKAEWKEA